MLGWRALCAVPVTGAGPGSGGFHITPISLSCQAVLADILYQIKQTLFRRRDGGFPMLGLSLLFLTVTPAASGHVARPPVLNMGVAVRMTRNNFLESLQPTF